MIVAGVEFNPVWERPSENSERILKYFDMATERNVDLLIFPEMTLTGFTMNGDIESSFDVKAFFRELVIRHRLSVIFGWIERKSDFYYNAATFMGTEGLEITYHKRRLFSYAGEEKHYHSGTRAVSYDFCGRKVSNFVCYDLRFPELFREVLGTEIEIVIANWPLARAQHWKTLLSARAIENQAIVLGVNRSGLDNQGIKYGQMSRGVDYLGRTIRATRTEKLLVWKLEEAMFEEQGSWRKRFNVIEDSKK